jgi:hypothetical protein
MAKPSMHHLVVFLDYELIVQATPEQGAEPLADARPIHQLVSIGTNCVGNACGPPFKVAAFVEVVGKLLLHLHSCMTRCRGTVHLKPSQILFTLVDSCQRCQLLGELYILKFFVEHINF